MRKILYAFAAMSAMLATCVVAVEKDEGVLVLTEANFDEELSKHEYLLVEFYAPWCGHCKKLTPEYAAAAAILAERNPPLYLAKVDATENNALAERFEVKGFPTLHWFVNGKRSDYTGGRTTDTIVTWISKKTGPVSEEVSCHVLNDKVADSKLNLVYFGDFSGEVFDQFMTAARNSENYLFFHAAGECAKAHGGKHNSLTIFRSFDKSPLHYEGDASSASVQSFMDKSSIPQLIEFSEDYIEPIFGKGNPAVILFTNDKDASFNKVFSQAAGELQGEILFVVSGTENGIQQRLAEFVGVDAAQAPTIRLLAPGEEMRKFVFHGQLSTLTVNSIKEFIQDFKAGTLRAHMKSEPEPTNLPGQVTVIVGTTYDKIVNDPTKDVLVKFYAPWCGHCKTLAPIWDELAAHVAGNEDLVIAKFDATANEAAGVSIKGYPTLKFYPKDNKSGIDFSGDRDLESFKKWLSENSAAYKDGASKHTTSDEL